MIRLMIRSAVFLTLLLLLSENTVPAASVRSPKSAGMPTSAGRSENAVPIAYAQNPPYTPTVLIANLLAFFRQWETSRADQYFGAYVMEPAANALYFGLSGSGPMSDDGSLLARYENNTTTAILNSGVNPITEQGLDDFTYVNGTLYVAGTDPTGSDGWDLGNVYTYEPGGQIVKHRTLPHVIHTLGQWVDPTTGDYYVSTTSDAPPFDDTAASAQLFKSTDGGATWAAPLTVGTLRGWDVIKFHNVLFVVVDGAPDDAPGDALKKSLDEGQTWQAIATGLASLPRLTVFKDTLLAVGLPAYARGSNLISVVSAAGTVATAPYPADLQISCFNCLANVDDQYLYAFTTTNHIIRTADLVSWEDVAAVDTPTRLIALAYWPNRNLLLASDRGPNAAIYSIDLTGNSPSPTPANTPTPPITMK